MSCSDDPNVIKAFLTYLKPDPDVDDERTDLDIGDEKPTDIGLDRHENPHPSAGTVTPVVADDVSSSTPSTPSIGTQPPPPTPESKSVVAKQIARMSPIAEDHTDVSTPADASTLSTHIDEASAYASYQQGRCLGPSLFFNHRSILAADRTYDLQSEAGFESRIQALTALTTAENTSPATVDHPAQSIDHTEPILGLQESSSNAPPQRSTRCMYNTVLESDMLTNSDISEVDNQRNIVVKEPSTPRSYKSATVDAGSYLSPDRNGTHLNDVTSTSLLRPTNEGESRENAMYFTSWGIPSHRQGPAASVRKVILSNLPTVADLTLVQSLIYGGAVESMTMHRNAEGATAAFFTFVDAEACNKYYEALPNGLSFKHKGKTVTVFVEKGKNVDVISGMMKNYLECGATRVVKVVGADNDWSMRALYKIAAGDPGRRVEAILDNYRDEIRTIVFRFANISDAVTFRGVMLRNPDWQDAEIQFAEDPCAKATGIHFE